MTFGQKGEKKKKKTTHNRTSQYWRKHEIWERGRGRWGRSSLVSTCSELFSPFSLFKPFWGKKKKERKKRANSLINARLADEQDIPHVGVRTRTRDTYTNIYTSAHLLLKIAKGKISSLFSINSVCVRERETCTS